MSLLFGAPAAAAGPFRAGAAAVDVTPPPFDPAHDAAILGPQSAACPPDVWNGPRYFDYAEPYQDSSGDGDFDYPEPYCDLNANGRWDGIYESGGPDRPARFVKEDDRPRARAFAVANGDSTLVVVSVSAEGLFENYTAEMRRLAQVARPGITAMIVSADHNESTPDTVGINGGPDPGIGAGGRSGIDDYYMEQFLVPKVAEAAVRAFDSLRPASLWARQFEIPGDLVVDLSNNWPTTEGIRGKEANDQPVAVDPKVGVLQARDSAGEPVFTVMSLAAHNQEIGHSGDEQTRTTLSGDWPGYFERALAASEGGEAVFLVGDNGSEEDPHTVPELDAAAGPGCPGGCFAQAKATGDAWARHVALEAGRAQRIREGEIAFERRELCVPLENHLFVAAFQAGLFAKRQSYVCAGGTMTPSGRAGDQLKTSVAVADVGPDLQLIGNPGEAFPALMVGSPWGEEDSPCSGTDSVDRSNPRVPTWRGRATYRFQVGLADDMIGYLSPGWAFTSAPGAFPTPCANDPDTDVDSKGHQHKLETEGVGPTASNAVANASADLLEKRPDPLAEIRRGRFVLADGSLSRRPGGAVAAWIADRGSDELAPGKGTVIAIDGVAALGGRAVDRSGVFMDYDGADQRTPGITSRGVLLFGCDGRPERRVYLDVFPLLRAPESAGAPRAGSASAGCVFPGGESGAAGGPGAPLGSIAAEKRAGCGRRVLIRSRIVRRSLRVGRRGVLLRGRSHELGCLRGRAAITAVTVSLARVDGRRCRFVLVSGRLSRSMSCRARRRPAPLGARGTRAWRLRVRAALPPGRYRAIALAYDAAGRRERSRRHANALTFRVGR